MSSVDLSTLPSSCKYAHDVPYADAKTVTNPDKETEVQGRTQNQASLSSAAQLILEVLMHLQWAVGCPQ